MQVIFYGNKHGSAFDNIIRWKTSSWRSRFNGDWKYSFSHVEILCDDGYMFSASQYDNKVRRAKHSYTGRAWIRMSIDISDTNKEKILRYMSSRLGSKYDYFGVVGFVFPSIKQDKKKDFCSEFCTLALQDLGLKEVKYLKPSKTSPNDLAFALGLKFDSKTKRWLIPHLRL